MTRKAKIRIVLATIVLGPIGWAFWLEEDEGELKVTYLSASPRISYAALPGSKFVTFTLTNSSKKPVEYFVRGRLTLGGQALRFRSWGTPFFSGRLMGRSTTNIMGPIMLGNRWTLEVTYARTLQPSFLDRARTSLSQYAFRHRWTRLAQWSKPPNRFKMAVGPEMTGDAPALTTSY